MILVALVNAGIRKILNFFGAALRAAYFAIFPAIRNHELLAVFKVAKMLDGFL
jgi:hypothetical protein